MSSPADELPAAFTPELLNELYRLYRKADLSERQQVLEAEVARRGLSAHQRKLDETFAVILGASYVFLDAYPGGAKESEQLWAENAAEIRKWSSWLDDENFKYAEHQSQYFAWHDGLVKTG